LTTWWYQAAAGNPPQFVPWVDIPICVVLGGSIADVPPPYWVRELTATTAPWREIVAVPEPSVGVGFVALVAVLVAARWAGRRALH